MPSSENWQGRTSLLRYITALHQLIIWVSLLEAALPGLRYAIAHGQMTGRQIEEIMTDFYEGHYDVLLSTSIIRNRLRYS